MPGNVDTITNNLNEIISTKNEFKQIIQENGLTAGTVFSEYPAKIRSLIGSGSGGGIADSYFNAYNFVYVNGISGTLPATPTPVRLGGGGDLVYVGDENWPYVGANIFTPEGDYSGHEFVGIGTLNNWLENYVPSASLDLSSYVTKTEVSAQSYVTEAVFNNGTGGFITDIQNSYANGQHILLYNRGQAITPAVLASCGYITSSDLPTIDENLIPNTTNTYTLGDGSHIYSNTYSRGIYLGTGVRMFSEGSESSNDMAISLGGVSYFYLNNNRFAPNGAANNEKIDLGTADRKWNGIYGKSINTDTSYTANIYAANVYLNDNNVLYNKTQYQVNLKLNGSDKYVFRTNHISPASNGGSDLGQSDLYWNNAYINNAYISNYNNLIWTGTSAQYAALADYTTYQIYLIQEA